MMKSRIKDLILAFAPVLCVLTLGLFIGYHYVDPAPPNHVVISTGADEGDYQTYAQQYKDIVQEDGIQLEIRPSSGALENLERLDDPKSDVEAGFVQDGIGGDDDSPNLYSLGSLYYEPIWIFYRGKQELTKVSQLLGRRIGVGEIGGGTVILAERLLKASGINKANSTFVQIGWKNATAAIKAGQLDAAFIIATAEDPFIHQLMADPSIHLMNLDQAEGITRQLRYLHHLVLPHGTLDLAHNIPDRDINMIGATATLLVRDSLHPALVNLLMKAATQIHNQPGIFEKKNEFPIDKDYSFTLSPEAERFYRSGGRFWQRYLPFWLATLVDRFMFVILPLLVVVIPLLKLIPQIMDWRVRSKIYKRYGELKFLETEIRTHGQGLTAEEFYDRLDEIEDRVNHMRVPLNFAEHIYGLREHIHFVRQRIERVVNRFPRPAEIAKNP